MTKIECLLLDDYSWVMPLPDGSIRKCDDGYEFYDNHGNLSHTINKQYVRQVNFETDATPGDANDTTLERTASLVHATWSHWMNYLFEQCEEYPDGSMMIPADLALRWQRQLGTDYGDLSEKEKDSDRLIASYYIALFHGDPSS